MRWVWWAETEPDVTVCEQLEIKLIPEPVLRRIPTSNYELSVTTSPFKQLELWDE